MPKAGRKRRLTQNSTEKKVKTKRVGKDCDPTDGEAKVRTKRVRKDSDPTEEMVKTKRVRKDTEPSISKSSGSSNKLEEEEESQDACTTLTLKRSVFHTIL